MGRGFLFLKWLAMQQETLDDKELSMQEILEHISQEPNDSHDGVENWLGRPRVLGMVGLILRPG